MYYINLKLLKMGPCLPLVFKLWRRRTVIGLRCCYLCLLECIPVTLQVDGLTANSRGGFPEGISHSCPAEWAPSVHVRDVFLLKGSGDAFSWSSCIHGILNVIVYGGFKLEWLRDRYFRESFVCDFKIEKILHLVVISRYLLKKCILDFWISSFWILLTSA